MTVRLGAIAYALASRASLAHRRITDLLALGMALARAGDPHRHDRRGQPARPYRFVAPRPGDRDLAPFGPRGGAPPLALDILRAPRETRTVHEDVATGRVDQHVGAAVGFRLGRVDWRTSMLRADTYTIIDGHPLSACVQCAHTISIARDAWQTRVETTSSMSADADDFHVTNRLAAYEGDGLRLRQDLGVHRAT